MQVGHCQVSIIWGRGGKRKEKNKAQEGMMCMFVFKQFTALNKKHIYCTYILF